MTKTELVQGTTIAEFYLAQHVISASHAVRCARRGLRECARMWGETARMELQSYLKYRK